MQQNNIWKERAAKVQVMWLITCFMDKQPVPMKSYENLFCVLWTVLNRLFAKLPSKCLQYNYVVLKWHTQNIT